MTYNHGNAMFDQIQRKGGRKVCEVFLRLIKIHAIFTDFYFIFEYLVVWTWQ
jgi:hypothetical protein